MHNHRSMSSERNRLTIYTFQMPSILVVASTVHLAKEAKIIRRQPRARYASTALTLSLAP